MIQRIQSVYLLLTTLLSVLFLNSNILSFINKTGTIIKITFRGLQEGSQLQGFTVTEKFMPLSVVLIIIPLLSIVTIFFFKKRIIQLWLSLILACLILFLILACAHASYLAMSRYSAEIIPDVKMVFPLLMLIFVILAYRGIKKDDRLVKSYDRLR